MPNQIERDVFVTKNTIKNPIHYVRGTDLLPIVFHFRDFSIPSGATARVFVAKPDGNAVYDSATIEGNDVTVDVTEQMFLVLGMTLMQISIFDGEEELVSFAQPVMVEQNLKAGDLPESTTDVSFLDDAIEQANQAVNTATKAASQAAQAVQNANQAIADANEAISDLNEQIASLNTNFASLSNNVSISQLQTTAKTLVGALNELNGKSYLLDGGIPIPSESDLDSDTFKNPGNYYCHKTSVAKTLINCPFDSAFVLKVSKGTGNGYPTQSFTEFRTRKIAERYYDIDLEEWSNWFYFSDDATLFTPQNVAITDGDYGHVNGNFRRIGSLLIFSFYIQLTKEYNIITDAIFTFNTIKSVVRYDFNTFGTYDSDLRVIDLYIEPNSNRARFNIGSGATIPRNSTLFCSGAMIIADL